VLPTGEILKTGVETAKGVVGYDLTRLIIGSEGTLAVITSITLRLIPKPSHKRTLLAGFADVAQAAGTVSDIIRHGVVPTAAEFMDRLSIECVREEIDISIPSGTHALLLMEVDGDALTTKKDADRILEICRQSGAVHVESGATAKEAENLWEVRRRVSEAVMKLRPNKISEDVVVPRNQMVALVDHLARLQGKYGLPIPAFGHAGDGNIHVNIMYDRNNPAERNRTDAVVRNLFMKVLHLGGTISGEHGIGLTKAPYMEMEIARPAIDLMIRLKKAFDPEGILNPGKIFLS
jgi:glycolate oxidase